MRGVLPRMEPRLHLFLVDVDSTRRFLPRSYSCGKALGTSAGSCSWLSKRKSRCLYQPLCDALRHHLLRGRGLGTPCGVLRSIHIGFCCPHCSKTGRRSSVRAGYGAPQLCGNFCNCTFVCRLFLGKTPSYAYSRRIPCRRGFLLREASRLFVDFGQNTFGSYRQIRHPRWCRVHDLR